MYTSIDFGKDLKKKLATYPNILEVSTWAHNDIFMKKCAEMDKKTDNTVMAICYMEMGEEYEYTIEELHEIADKLIAGEEVDI